jgi:uncharacterized Fe-S radical SAM superfamily protein PflX
LRLNLVVHAMENVIVNVMQQFNPKRRACDCITRHIITALAGEKNTAEVEQTHSSSLQLHCFAVVSE